LFERPRGDGNRSPFTRKGNRNRAANAATATGDECESVC
jgi:hypothetical protein